MHTPFISPVVVYFCGFSEWREEERESVKVKVGQREEIGGNMTICLCML